MTWIGVVDCNNFFVSCERLFRPDLKKRPVAVLSSNDGCLVARSQEVKDMDIPMGVPYFKVKDIIKDNNVTLFSSHFALYRDVSRRVFLTLRELLDNVEQYSIDEAFFTISDEVEPEIVAKGIKDEIEQRIGIPVSVGLASSKTKAKYAVGVAKRTNGVNVLTEADWQSEVESIKLSSLWGIGGRSYMRYREAGYETVADLLKADRSRIKRLFGVNGERLLAELSNKAVFKVEERLSDQKSLMSSRSFKESSSDLSVLEDAIAYHTRHIAADLRKQNLIASVVRISIQASRYSDFLLQGASLEAILDKPTNDTLVLLKATQELLNKAFKTSVPYKKVGVTVGHLISNKTRQMSLFEKENTPKNNKLMSLVDQLNIKADRELVTIGERRKKVLWSARKNLVSPAYTTKWTDVAVVKA